MTLLDMYLDLPERCHPSLNATILRQIVPSATVFHCVMQRVRDFTKKTIRRGPVIRTAQEGTSSQSLGDWSILKRGGGA